MKLLTLMKLFLFLSWIIFTPVPEDLANISSIQRSKFFWFSVFSQSQLTHSWLYFWNILRNHVISAVLMLFQMAPNLHASNRIFYWTYNLCLIILLTWPNRSAKNLILLLPQWQSLIPLVLKPGLQKITRNMRTSSLDNWKLLSDHITLKIHMILTKLLIALCQLMLLPIRQSSRCTSIGVSAMLINLESLQMGLALSATLLSTTKIFSNPIQISLLKRNRFPW